LNEKFDVFFGELQLSNSARGLANGAQIRRTLGHKLANLAAQFGAEFC
jgi:hypothetical protein